MWHQLHYSADMRSGRSLPSATGGSETPSTSTSWDKCERPMLVTILAESVMEG